jgi:NADH dehydrogenase/NADH:ubiquinone oxidoreductase subunit G
MNIEDYRDIFEPFEKLIEIEILGKKASVPENNTLLRCFQYLALESISMGEFCWNGDCANCQVWLEAPGGEKPALACRTRVENGMKIVRMSKEISLQTFG